MAEEVIVIGGGLAGSEAAWQLAERGIRVKLFEMRPKVMTPAHRTGLLAELVCSNSLKSQDLLNAHGLLKAELRMLGSMLLEAAREASIPGGKALVVDREKFAKLVTERIENHPLIEIMRDEVTEIPNEGIVIIATGPLTSPKFAESLQKLIGEQFLSFYDALSPIVAADSLDMSKLYFKDRYGWDDSAYLNAPMTEEEYDRFWNELVNAEIHQPHEFEKDIKYFEACLPIEVMAKRDRDALRFGPLKPIGLPDPRTGREPFAVVQLRRENAEGTAYSLVGFQTQLKYSEQKRVFRLIPGLENAVFLRYGAVHRNTFVNAPKVLLPTLQVRREPRIFIAGQLSGTEGYVEAIADGLVAAINAYRLVKDMEPVEIPYHTMLGALLRYIAMANPKYFQPMNANFGLMIEVPKIKKKEERKRFLVERAIRTLKEWIEANPELFPNGPKEVITL